MPAGGRAGAVLTLGTDKGYGAAEFIQALEEPKVVSFAI
ncbi:hypothetical protein GGD56_007179 [Rhizobium mongolense]|uniref:Uncharacterized protein n=1 Tax=Rhizobium mongolense TaxID=57676 RepID=A0ABR6IZC5_9HYPH|nr:hypothetical protein [Rhizobium mongolense]